MNYQNAFGLKVKYSTVVYKLTEVVKKDHELKTTHPTTKIFCYGEKIDWQQGNFIGVRWLPNGTTIMERERNYWVKEFYEDAPRTRVFLVVRDVYSNPVWADPASTFLIDGTSLLEWLEKHP